MNEHTVDRGWTVTVGDREPSLDVGLCFGRLSSHTVISSFQFSGIVCVGRGLLFFARILKTVVLFILHCGGFRTESRGRQQGPVLSRLSTFYF